MTPEAAVSKRYILNEYVERAIEEAVYNKLDDGAFSGRIPSCPGVIAFPGSLRGCEEERRSTLEDWILGGLKLHRPLPVIGNIDLNKELRRAFFR